MKYVFNKKFQYFSEQITLFIENFSSEGTVFGNQKRNSLKTFTLNDTIVNVKSFKKPNLVNRIVYRFFRKSKAQRSFEYAQKLQELGVGTPQPIAFAENHSTFFFLNSYYASEHLEVDLTFRELVKNIEYPDYNNILEQFTKFTYILHEKGIQFLDHSPGNTLIKKNGNKYDFYLVDLNRMQFKNLTFKDRMQNFSRLTPKKEMVLQMSNTYAELIGKDTTYVFNAMWKASTDFQNKIKRKKQFKKQLLNKK